MGHSENFAESVALIGMSTDGEITVNARLARFPGKGLTNLWAAITVGDRHFSVAEELPLKGFQGQTEIGASHVQFRQPGDEFAWFLRNGLSSSRFDGDVALRGSAFEDRYPPLGPGNLRIGFNAEFSAAHEPAATRNGRIEVFGAVAAVVETPGGTVTFEGFGKWHEQTGERPKFGQPFTYLSVQNRDSAVLARASAGGAWGFALANGEQKPVREFRIEPPAERREFEIRLEDNSVIHGVAVQRWLQSVPIEGQRRPGAFVDVVSELGQMMGQLNDWAPVES